VPLIETDIAPRRIPIANWCLMAVVLLSFYLRWVVSERAFRSLMLESFSVRSLITYQFLHAHFFHLAWNLLLLWVLGNLVCSRLGALVYVPLFLACGIGAGLVHLAAGGPAVVGASGSARGLMAVCLVLWGGYSIRCLDDAVRFPIWVPIAVFIFKDIASLGVAGRAVSHVGHLGGLASGAVLGIVIRAAGIDSSGEGAYDCRP
jgi:membrane associated rhomboid family serine protease